MRLFGSYVNNKDILFNRINKTKNDCWEYAGTKDNHGYGQFCYRGKRYKTHRLSWLLTHGKIPKGLLVCHKCDNPPCINPKHLFLGTHKINSEDMVRKGRGIPKKEKCLHGHIRANNIDKRGYCLSCEKIRGKRRREYNRANND